MVMEVTRCTNAGSLRQRQKPGLQEPSTHDSQAVDWVEEEIETEVMETSCGVKC